MKEVKFINASENEFTDISTEMWREYTFPNKERIRISNEDTYTDVVRVRIHLPKMLSVSKTGGHRIFDASGHSHYIPSGWVHLEWQAFTNEPHFVK